MVAAVCPQGVTVKDATTYGRGIELHLLEKPNLTSHHVVAANHMIRLVSPLLLHGLVCLSVRLFSLSPVYLPTCQSCQPPHLSTNIVSCDSLCQASPRISSTSPHIPPFLPVFSIKEKTRFHLTCLSFVCI